VKLFMLPGDGRRNPALVDLHVHSVCSADGLSSIADYARQAAALGLGEVGFCEHVDFDPRDQDYGYLDILSYEQQITRARRQSPQVTLQQGVEVSYQSRREDEIRTWLSTCAWDCVVTSVHLVDYDDGWAIVSEPDTAGTYFAAHGQRQAYAPYLEELCRAACSGLGDVLGHLDLIKRFGVAHYGPFEPVAFEEEIRAVLQAAIDGGLGLEVNTSGLRQSPGEAYPTLAVLRWYRELGGEIVTVGSDAHHAGDLGAGIPEALAMAQEAGFRAIATFKERQVRWIDL
jgi:histidinol-phosphatase (PHP family)